MASEANEACTAARARSATPCSSRSSSRAAMAYSWFRSVPNIGGSSLFTVTGTPAATSSRIGCRSRSVDDLQGHVRGRADVQGDLVLRQVVEQFLIMNRRDAVLDPLRAQVDHRVPDGLGSGGLAGVRHAVQSGGPGAVEMILEHRAREPVFRRRRCRSRPAPARHDQVRSRAVTSAAGIPKSAGMSKIHCSSTPWSRAAACRPSSIASRNASAGRSSVSDVYGVTVSSA